MAPQRRSARLQETETEETQSVEAGTSKKVPKSINRPVIYVRQRSNPASRNSSPAPPTIPTPPWLHSPLPSQSGSEHDNSIITTPHPAPEPAPPSATPVTPAGIKNTIMRADPQFAKTSDPGLLLRGVGPDDFDGTPPPRAEAFQSRARSMSPPEEDLEVLQAAGVVNGTMVPLGPLTCTTLSLHDAMMLRMQLQHDTHRLNVLGEVLKSMQELKMPHHDMVWNLLLVTEGGYNCPFPQCSRHQEGWTRADRTRAHIYADHLLIRYKCDKCNSYFKREQDFNIHVASHDKQPAFECPVCNKSFPKKFNLNRHLRQIHDYKPTTKTQSSQALQQQQQTPRVGPVPPPPAA
ncbi:SubName: Full=Uncharacterized protein {ECO:0000313/EMBL:CCA70576.1} [Serendipita indica DSM 11827]|uniref:C2H2-type domain-containing protein n=1 Tax=Serendipita indica (strain DSM 11827) TaxID=1109443 RepID=G4TGY2_SERID|nr:SubName: Full=Uncharacterized protein {ECO:0000313/EMBL:CCA70576.1} [Serendipita indica DSM 11827]CCA70576.1 hypothetical protein PIIN_04513 [Serendipita indica DSM 11827]